MIGRKRPVPVEPHPGPDDVLAELDRKIAELRALDGRLLAEVLDLERARVVPGDAPAAVALDK
jgi:hypothetical protein